MKIKIQICILIFFLLAISVVSSLFHNLQTFRKSGDKHQETLIENTITLIESTILGLEEKARNESTLLAKDSRIIQTFATGNKDNLKKIGNEYRKLFHLDIMDFYSIDEDLILTLPLENNSNKDLDLEEDFEIPEHLIEKAVKGEVAVDYVYREGKFAMIAAAPVGQEKPYAGVIVCGSYISDQVAQKMKKQTKLDITFYTLDSEASASSLTSSKRIETQTENVKKNYEALYRSEKVRIDDYLLKPFDLLNKDDDDLGFAIIRLSLEEFLAREKEIVNEIGLIGLVILLVSLVVGFLVAYRITKPISSLEEFTKKVMVSENLSFRADVKTIATEILTLQNTFNSLLDEIENKQIQLKEYSENLEVKVQERTSELAFQKSKIQRILDHIEIGILTFDEHFRIANEHSAFLGKLYNKQEEELIKTNAIELLLPKSNINENDMNQIVEGFKCTFRQDELNWELNLHHFPFEAQIIVSGERKSVQFGFTPILNEFDEVIEVMATVKDVSEHKELEREIQLKEEQNQEKYKILTEIIQQERSVVSNFFSSVENKISEIFSMVKMKVDTNQLFIKLHTMKGEARSLKFNDLVNNLHLAEDEVQKIKKNKDFNLEVFNTIMAEVEQDLEKYVNVFQEFFTHEKETDLSLHAIVHQHLGVLKNHLDDYDVDLQKISVSDEILYWNKTNFTKVVSIVLHALNNCIDHGYLFPLERGEKVGKLIIEIFAYRLNDDVVFEVKDQGNGLNIQKIRDTVKGTPQENLSIDEILFGQNISTAEKITHSSGRGAGLNAIYGIVVELNGQVKIYNNEHTRGSCVYIKIPLKEVVAENLL